MATENGAKFWQKVSFWISMIYSIGVIVVATCTFIWGRGYESSSISLRIKAVEQVAQSLNNQVNIDNGRLYTIEKQFYSHEETQKVCVQNIENSVRKIEIYMDEIRRKNSNFNN
jgi:hypothetical protein